MSTSRDLVVRARSLASGDQRVLIGIAGEPGAGKTTLATELADGVTGAVLVPMDGFHLSGAELERLGRADRKGAPDTFDAEGYVALLRRLRDPAAGTVRAPEFRREIEETVPDAIEVPAEAILVITEGNYLLLDESPWVEVRGLLDEAWSVKTDHAMRVKRLLARHVENGRSPAAARAWVEAVDEPNAALIRATSSRADRVVSL